MLDLRRRTSGGSGVLEMTNENFARLLRGLTIAWEIGRTAYFSTSSLRRRSGHCTTHMELEMMSPTREL